MKENASMQLNVQEEECMPRDHQKLIRHTRMLTSLHSSQDFEGANVCFGSVQDTQSVEGTAFSAPVDVVVSCLASRTGGKVYIGKMAFINKDS